MAVRRALALFSCFVLAALANVAPSRASTGGRAAAEASGGIAAGGQTIAAPEPRAARFAVLPAEVPGDQAGRLTFRYRIEGRASTVRAHLLLTRRGERRPAARVGLGRVRTGQRHARTWALTAGRLAPGEYVVALTAADDAGRHLSPAAPRATTARCSR